MNRPPMELSSHRGRVSSGSRYHRRMRSPDLSSYREYFPVTKNLIYLNHAAVAPLVRPAAEAMEWLAKDSLEYGSLHYPKWLETYQGLRHSAARLMNCDTEEIALM